MSGPGIHPRPEGGAEAQFLAWLSERGESIRAEDAVRVMRELRHLAGGRVGAEHVDRLLDGYRRRFEGANRIMAACRAAELFCIWQVEGEWGLDARCVRVAPPAARSPLEGTLTVNQARAGTWQAHESETGTEADIPTSDLPAAIPAVADDARVAAHRRELPAVLGGPPVFSAAFGRARPATIHPPKPGSVPPWHDTGSVPAPVMLPPRTRAPSRHAKRIGGLIAALVSIVVLVALIVDGGTCGGARVAVASEGPQVSEHLGMQFTFAGPWSHAQDLDREETEGDWERRTSVYFRGSDPVQYDSKLTIIVLSRRDGSPANEADVRSAGASETLSMTVRDRSCRPVVERAGNRCRAFNLVGAKVYDAIEHFFLLDGRVVYVRGLFRLQGAPSGVLLLDRGELPADSIETDLVVASLAPLVLP